MTTTIIPMMMPASLVVMMVIIGIMMLMGRREDLGGKQIRRQYGAYQDTCALNFYGWDARFQLRAGWQDSWLWRLII